MRVKTKEMVRKVENVLIENTYQRAKDLAEKTHMSVGKIYQLVRSMRLDNVGIMPTNKGYILSRFATKKDDVNFLRRLYGRRTSDYIAIKACEQDIRHRWKTSAEREQLQTMLLPLSSDVTKSKAFNVLLTSEKKLDK